MAKSIDRLNAWLEYAESDLVVMRDGVSWALSFSLVHVVANILALEPDESHLRSCASASVTALLLGVTILVTVTASMGYRSIYGPSMVVDALTSTVNIVASSVLAMLSKEKGFYAHGNERDECSLLVGFFPSVLGWLLGEFGAILSGFVWVLAWRRNPPFGFNPWLVIVVLGGISIALVFLADLWVAPFLSRALGNTTDAAGS